MYITKKYTTGSKVPFTVTGSIQDKNNAFYNAGDIISVTYTIYKVTGGKYLPETDMENVAVIPSQCFFSPEVNNTFTSGYYNFQHTIPANENLFSVKGGKYMVDYRIHPSIGEVFGFTIYVNVI